MKYNDKQIKTEKAGADEKGQDTFMFPHGSKPLVIKAKDLVEATEKFEKITSEDKNQ